MEGYTTLGFLAAHTVDHPARAAGHRRHLPPPRPARQDRRDARRALRGPGRARHRRGLVRPRARGPRRSVPAGRRAVRTARGDAADLLPDVERRRRAVRRQALPARRDDLPAAADQPAAPARDDRRERRAQDAAPRRPVRRRVQPVRDAGRTRSSTSSTCCARHCDRRRTRLRHASRRRCCTRATRSPTPTRSSRSMRVYADLGIDTVIFVPSGDPVEFTKRLGPVGERLADL